MWILNYYSSTRFLNSVYCMLKSTFGDLNKQKGRIHLHVRRPSCRVQWSSCWCGAPAPQWWPSSRVSRPVAPPLHYTLGWNHKAQLLQHYRLCLGLTWGKKIKYVRNWHHQDPRKKYLCYYLIYYIYLWIQLHGRCKK